MRNQLLSLILVVGVVAVGSAQLSTAPYPGIPEPPGPVPACGSHDSSTWHALYDPARNCHYDHEHKADPSTVDHLFGPNNAISYPWQTLSENQTKHEGYAWWVLREKAFWSSGVELNCDQQLSYVADEDGCITAGRLQTHVLPNARSATVRFHSFWMELRVCDNAGQVCGVVKTGGWADTGALDAPYKQVYVPLPGDPAYFDPAVCGFECRSYRGHHPHIHPNNPRNIRNRRQATWSAAYDAQEERQLFTFRIRDMSGGVDLDDPWHVQLTCPDAQCADNGTEFAVYSVEFTLRQDQIDWLDGQGAISNGRITYTGWTDRHGEIVTNCASAGVDCVPLELGGIPIPSTGRFSRFYTGTHSRDTFPEFDTSPPGAFWVDWFATE